MKLLKKLTAVLISITCMLSCLGVNAEEIGGEVTSPVEDEYVDILILGNSLVRNNSMCTVMLPEICASAGKKARITSITQSGAALYQFANESTSIGMKTINALSENTYDYVVLEPSRKVTPFEYTVYHAEKAAALKLNKMINAMGAKTLILAEPGVNTGSLKVHTMNENGVGSASTYSLPIDRNTHSVYFENMCNDMCSQLTNAEVVRIGAATEVLLKYFPDYNSLYLSDNRHPSVRGSYLQALCIYSAIFDEDYIGKSYISTLYKYNAVIAQRAASVATFCVDEEIMLENECERVIDAELVNNTTAKLCWVEPTQADYYEIYRKIKGSKYELLGKTVSNECEYVDATLEPGLQYYYKIKAVESVGDLSFSLKYSSVASVKTLVAPQEAILTLNNRKTATIDITQVEGAEYYNIYRLKEGEQDYKFIASTYDLQYIDQTLSANNTYYYKITAVKQGGEVESEGSIASKIVSLKTPLINLTSTKKGNVTIDITAVNGATGYAIYVKAKGESDYTFVAETSNLKYKAKTLVSGKVYYFKIRAFKDENINNQSSIYRIRKIRVK